MIDNIYDRLDSMPQRIFDQSLSFFIIELDCIEGAATYTMIGYTTHLFRVSMVVIIILGRSVGGL